MSTEFLLMTNAMTAVAKALDKPALIPPCHACQSTDGKWAVPQIEQAIESGRMPSTLMLTHPEGDEMR